MAQRLPYYSFFCLCLLLFFVQSDAKRKNRTRRKRKPQKTPSPTPKPTSRPTPSPVIPTMKSEQGNRFRIELINMGNDTSLDELFRHAAHKWERVIHGDLPTFRPPRRFPNFDLFAGRFDKPYNKDVDDVVIGYSVDAIDGRGRVLGKASPLYYRGSRKTGGYSTVSGSIRLDKADFDIKTRHKRDLLPILTHEIGHVLGIGPVSRSICAPLCRPAYPKAVHPEYKCRHAGHQAVAMGLLKSPKQLTMLQHGGRGTACSHLADLVNKSLRWSDVMSSRFEAGKSQLITRVDLGALQDLGGYTDIKMGHADAVPRRGRGLEKSAEASMTPKSSFQLRHHATSEDGVNEEYLIFEDNL